MSRKFKNIIIYVLLLSMMLSIFPTNTYAAVPTTGELNGMKALRTKEGFKNITDDMITSEATTIKSDGKVLITSKKVTYAGVSEYKYLNVGVYKNYDVIVYGERHGTKDKFGEYRYLGWDENGIEITNDRFQNDADSTTDLTKKNWIKVDEYENTWKDFATYQEQIDQILTKKPIENDGESINLSISEILANRTNSSNIKQYVQVMVGPRLTSKGTVKLQQRTSNGKVWYDSFTIPKLNYNFTAPTVSIAAKSGTYIINETDTEITIPIDVTANVSMSPPLGKTPAQIIQISSSKPGMMRLSYEGAEQEALITGSTAKAAYNKTFKRSDLKIGINDVPLTGFIDYAESIYGDKWSGISGTNIVKIEVKAPSEPYVELTATPVPDSVRFSDADIPVKVNVSAALQSYTNVANINNVVIYAKFDDDPANIYQTKTLAAATTASTTFDFTIPKSKVVGDNFDQKFKVTATFKYKSPVNSNTNVSGTAYCITNIYKEEPIPPIPGNIPPKAKIKAPAEIKAGDEFLVDGSYSSDKDGYIADYQWSLPGTGIELYGESGDIWYTVEGEYTIGLKVTDDGGARDSTTKSIVVLPPTPEAKIKILGTLKENRKFTIDASNSTSPTHYPIVWSNTTWGLSAVSGNSNSDIKYNGMLNGNKTKDILIKKAGTDRVQLSVFNTKPLGDTDTLNLNIALDKPPIADFSTVTSIFRNPEDTNYSLITINDTSFSTDNDYIKNSILTFSYDSDNNGVFNNGSIQIDAAAYTNGQTKTVATTWGFNVLVTVYKPIGKPIQFDIKTKNVGKYYIDLKAIEGFGQETIPEFIMEADYRYDDTSDKPNIEKTIEVLNLAPVAGFNMTNKQKADIVIALPDNISKASVESQLNSKVIPGLVNNNMDYNIRYVDYETYIPQPVDNYYYVLDSDKKNDELRLYQYSYATGGIAKSLYLTHLDNRYTELFITNTNQVYVLYQSSFYEGNGISRGYYRFVKFDGNNGLSGTIIYNTYQDVIAKKGGQITNLRMNKEGTIYYDYKGATYGRTLTGSANFLVDNPINYDMGKTYAQLSTTSPSGYTYSVGNFERLNRPWSTIVASQNGTGQVLYEQRMSMNADTEDREEWLLLGKFYPPDDLYTIDEAFNSITWADDYEKYFVTLSTRNITELSNSYNINNMVTKSIIDNVTLVNLGNSTNKNQFESLIEKNDGTGLYTDVTNLDNAFTKLTDYILKRINVDLVFNIGQTGYTIDIIREKVNSILKPKLAASNISASISYISSATDMNSALSSAIWNPLKDHMFIQIQDTVINELNDSAKVASILDSLRANEADIIGLGRSINSNQINNLVSSNSSEGTYIDNTNLDTAVNSLGDYVVAYARRKLPNIYKYAILGEEILYNTTYKDIENDPMYSERWKYTHNESYFENNLGRISDSGAYRPTSYTIFGKTGKYEVTYGTRDNPKDNNLFDNYRLWSNGELSKATILVHRKPIASYLWNITFDSTTLKYSIVTTDTSEDLDHISSVGKGIVRRQWKWKLPSDTYWQPGIPTEIVRNNKYLLQLMVQDKEGAWSDPYIQEITIPYIIVDAVPAYRDWANTNVSVNVYTITPYSYPLQKVNYLWTNSKNMPTSGWLTNTSNDFNTTQTKNGEWYLHLVGYNTRGDLYYTYKGPYRIDKIAPTITADKTNAESSQPVMVNVIVYDTGGSGLKDVKYFWNKTTTKPTAGWTISKGSFSTIQDQEGLWYLHIEATDNAGNITYKYFGSYKVNTHKLENFRVVMVRDIHLESYYKNQSPGLGKQLYLGKPMYVSNMAIDYRNFDGNVDGLTKGYKFEFEIDSTNFNENTDTIIIEPHFYTTDGFIRDSAERDLYWEDSNHQVFKVGEGGHSTWKTITLESSNRIINGENEAVWRGEYLIPGSAWAVPKGTTKAQAKAKDLNRDIIISFHIKGYKNGLLQFDYNAEQWGKERSSEKYPYLIGDVIKYSWDKNCLNDINAKDNR